MLALIGHNALFSYLTRLHKYGYVCPLHSFCEKEKYDKDECYDEPWNGKMCPMTIMGDVIHIKGKFYQFNLSSCIRQQNSLTAQFVSFSLSNLANIFCPPPIFTIINLCLL